MLFCVPSAGLSQACVPCVCDPRGTVPGSVCDSTTGQCVCVPTRNGQDCSGCRPGECVGNNGKVDRSTRKLRSDCLNEVRKVTAQRSDDAKIVEMLEENVQEQWLVLQIFSIPCLCVLACALCQISTKWLSCLCQAPSSHSSRFGIVCTLPHVFDCVCVGVCGWTYGARGNRCCTESVMEKDQHVYCGCERLWGNRGQRIIVIVSQIPTKFNKGIIQYCY